MKIIVLLCPLSLCQPFHASLLLHFSVCWELSFCMAAAARAAAAKGAVIWRLLCEFLRCLRSTCGNTCGHLRGLQAYKLQAARPLPSRLFCPLCVCFVFFYTTRLRGANPQPVGYEFRSQYNSGNSFKKHHCQSICCDLRVKKVSLRKTCGTLAEVYATSLERPFYINLQLRGFRSTLIC